MNQEELLQRLEHLLEELDRSLSPTSELAINSKIKGLHSPDVENEPPLEWKAEAMAFDFCENYADKDTGWGTYFGPNLLLRKDDGSVVESPSIRLVDEHILNYWSKRTKECANPLLKARYAGLIWDFTQKVTGRPPSYEIGREYIVNLLAIAKNDLHEYAVDTIKKLQRALSVAIALNASDLISDCKNTIVEYEHHVAVDDKPGLWGFSFDFLLNNKKVNLSQEENAEILNTLEARLERLTTLSEDTKPDL
jgi:hypothetical protein